MDTFTWNDVMFNNFFIGIMLNHDNLPFNEYKDTRFDSVQEEFMEQELQETIGQSRLEHSNYKALTYLINQNREKS